MTKKKNTEEDIEPSSPFTPRMKRSYQRIFGGRLAHMKKGKFAWFIFSKGYDAGYRAAKKETD